MSSRAQIIATVGPVSATEDIVFQMIQSGMDVARINFSHGTNATNGAAIACIRAAATKAGTHIPIIMDLPGPRMQTADGHGFNQRQEATITPHDLELLNFGVEQKIDYIAQSYVGTADDVRAMRHHIAERGASMPLIAKIERQEAVDAFDAILAEADAIMIARGDLGNAVPIEEVPFIERDLILRTRNVGKTVITATEMLFTMTERTRPTRAEVTDVAYAIMLGSDVVMLSDETAKGKYPIEAVATMERIVVRAEREHPMHVIRPLI